ncbi:hypothetical protein GLOTRDRAFT_92575 [Gloeophyllum trabeum ATCC 11539]|uniref:F-box domain-containing protein n=1 Tax=Gloeophyllum trabeum (strain ATCC 11539 / FP-39264 / Madison 617) TaxID=670483 RepID=S7QCH0_GLOTA|nr:uncharacterized protein GLOTRDRAFT_92575 [Gloeophyllum trabeum ATCC 11539]EPQ57576.1 hypothetical protein GLOTRDRAFT_92575 [Gloeophyllum trabeum ATCC 11539]
MDTDSDEEPLDNQVAIWKRKKEKEFLRLQAGTLVERNSQCGPNRLTKETLAEIFQLVQGDDYSDVLIPFTHVCHHWRAVAIGKRRLWTKPSTSHPELVELIIERSRGRGLHLTLDQPDSIQPWLLNAAIKVKLAHLDQAVSLKLDIPLRRLLPLCGLSLPPVPILESLELAEPKIVKGLADADTLFRKHAPYLYHLTIRKDLICLSASVFARLQSLEISTMRIDINRLATALADVGLLERLIFCDVETTLEGSEDEITAVPLDFLEELAVQTNDLMACVNLMSCLRIRRPVRLDIEVAPTKPAQLYQVEAAMTIVERYLTGDGTVPLLSVELESDCPLSFIAWNYIGEGGYPPLNTFLGSRVRINMHPPYDITQGRALLLLRTVRALRIHKIPHLSALGDLCCLLDSMTEVEALDLTDDPTVVAYVLPLLSTTRRYQNAYRPVMLPRLMCLMLSKPSWGRRWDPPPGMSDPFDCLRDYLQERLDDAEPIHQLHIRARWLQGVDLTVLGKYVVKLHLT